MPMRHGPLTMLAVTTLFFAAATVEAEPPAATDVANLHVTLDDTYPANGVTPGSSSWVVYDLVATNDGPGDTVATITSQVPLATSWRCSATGGAACPAEAGGGGIYHSIAMPAGARVVYRLECGARPIFSAFPAVARIAAASHDDNLDDNTAMVVTPVFNPRNADLAVSIAADRTSAMVGDSVGYTVQARNNGAEAVNAEILMVNSAYLGEPAWTCQGTGGGTCSTSSFVGDTASQLVQLPAGASVALAVAATLQAAASGETYTQRAWVLGRDANDLANADNHARAVAHVAVFRGSFD